MMKRVVSAAAAVVLGLTAGTAAAQNPAYERGRARVYKAERGQALARGADNASPVAIVGQFLRGQGVDAATIQTIVGVGQSRARGNGAAHSRMEQRVAGLAVFDAYVKAAFNGRGDLVHVVEHLARVPQGGVGRPEIDEERALAIALRRLHPDLAAPSRGRKQGNTQFFAKGRGFYDAPSVTRVAVTLEDGSMETGFLVETWVNEGNLLHETLVGSKGAVLDVMLRTNTDSYNVFTQDPATTPQQVVPGGTGWLFPTTHRTIDIAGNNVHAYLDATPDGVPDGGGQAVTNGNFLASFDDTISPTETANKSVAVQNLFYLNNVIHDTLWEHGFTEAVGNFQENNFGRGGIAGDSVNAEAQDGAGTDNANFATPKDGRNPRMQMFLWSGKGTHQLVVDAPAPAAGIYRAAGAAFGPELTPAGIAGDLAIVDDGTAPTTNGCEASPAGSLAGKIAIIDRGTCAFTVKVKNAQNAGASAAVIVNTTGDSLIVLGGADDTITIPAVLVGLTDGTTIKNGLGTGATGMVRLTDPPPLQRDGDLDSDIVWHEYGHGLTWRMIDRMYGPLAGAIGEGMADVLALIINENDVIGEYSFDDPVGIRRNPYTNYPRDYGDVVGEEVHNDGEVYAAIGWRLWEIFKDSGLSKDRLLSYLVDGMNYTPTKPTFENMRDGILAAVDNAGETHQCLIWEAFADYGVGVGAFGQVRGQRAVVTASFEVPGGCN
jgi:extracellular elastinolytic metalloproteinase